MGLLSLLAIPPAHSISAEGEAGCLAGRARNAVSGLCWESTLRPSMEDPVALSRVTVHWRKGNTQTTHKLGPGSAITSTLQSTVGNIAVVLSDGGGGAGNGDS